PPRRCPWSRPAATACRPPAVLRRRLHHGSEMFRKRFHLPDRPSRRHVRQSDRSDRSFHRSRRSTFSIFRYRSVGGCRLAMASSFLPHGLQVSRRIPKPPAAVHSISAGYRSDFVPGIAVVVPVLRIFSRAREARETIRRLGRSSTVATPSSARDRKSVV